MRILIAEDDIVSRKVLTRFLEKWGHEVIAVKNGNEAIEVLKGDDAPNFAILDWMMPEKDGTDVCQWVRQQENGTFVYIILLTARTEKDDIITGLSSGADDYVTKPFNVAELKQRVMAGERIIMLESRLQTKIDELEDAFQNIKQLHGILPICAWCKKIKDGDEYWHSVEEYITSHSKADFTHGICPECLEKQEEIFPEKFDAKTAT
ncbi:MAG: response regulator [Candidatus Zixiibacteriota bacterium]|nr:MAG: response regulator [candidate division Zixibacteria bacterium]HHI02498.1 response regulator transcription factor [candidate division Zixibacteria bacterium]